MFRITTLTSFKRHLLIGAVLAGIIVPVAGAVTRPPDVQDTASASLTAQLSPPDIREAALSTSVPTEDVFERYASAHPFGAGLSAANLGASRPPDVRDAALGSSFPVPDVVERYAIAHGYLGGPSQQLSVPRPPDVADAALTVQFSPVHESSDAFNWGDWAIGIGSGIGMTLILGAGLVTTRQVRQRFRPA